MPVRKRRVKFNVRLVHGNLLQVPAYYFGQGVYLHKFINVDFEPTKYSHWVVSAEGGGMIADCGDATFSKVCKAIEILMVLDWTKLGGTTMDTKPYRELRDKFLKRLEGATFV